MQLGRIVINNKRSTPAPITCEAIKYSRCNSTIAVARVRRIKGGVQTKAMVIIVLVIEGPKIAAMMIASSKLGYDIKISLTSMTALPQTLGQKAALSPKEMPTSIARVVALRPINKE